ncbi:MAG: diadenylate cyclase CdaA [Clostridia bacterium]|nr:diadenylate cyclase CdaA [Clostridia bacterium]
MSFWESFVRFISLMRPGDFIDIIIVAFALYKGIHLVKETRAQQLVKGIVLLVIILGASTLFQLHTITYILKNTMQVGVLAVLIVFQPELRRALEKFGRSNLGNFFGSIGESIDSVVNEVSDAVSYLSLHRIGALIVLEKETKLGEIVATGTPLQAEISKELLINIFIPNTPLHDGAVVIQEGKISAAACLLPLTQNDTLSRELGTRHRAALGISEISDAIVIVVSEETGTISMVHDGDMVRNLTHETLRRAMYKNLADEQTKKPIDGIQKWKEKLPWTQK